MVPRSHSLSQHLNVDRTLDQLVTEGCGLIDSFMIYWTIKLWCGMTNFVVIIELGCFELTNKELIAILNWPCKAHTYIQ